MPTRRRILTALAALSAAAALVAGCSSSSEENSAPLPDAAALLTESSQSTRDLKNVHLFLTVTGQIKDLPIRTLNGDLTNDPSTAAQGDATITLAGSAIDIDFVVFDKTLYATLTPNIWSDFGPAADLYDVSAILDPAIGLANVLTNFTDPNVDARETINGVESVRVSGIVSADAVNKIAPRIAATGPVPGTAWIRADGNHDLVRVKLDTSPGNAIEMTLSEWGKPVTVAKPAV
jgi:lipoprotein LprG